MELPPLLANITVPVKTPPATELKLTVTVPVPPAATL